jgi:capsule biosynthesis phosphatase
MTISARTIVVDVDDTISTHIDRDYENAIPHLDIIAKLNDLYDQGWYIIYFTARGQVSCNGDLKLIEETKGPTLRSWLDKNNVKHHELRFGKPIGVYYIDDKAIRPDDFLKLDFKKLEGGSGAHVELVGDRVIKRGNNLKSQVEWYNIAKRNNINVPEVYTFYDNTIDMEYIKGTSFNDLKNLTEANLDKLVSCCRSIAYIPVEYEIPDWSTMVDRVKEHLTINAVPHETEIMKMIDHAETHVMMNRHKSFMHGDLSLSNVIVKNDINSPEFYFIDPNYTPNVYSSYILDFGKIMQSIDYCYEETFFEESISIRIVKYNLLQYILDKSPLDENLMFYVRLMELIHYIRMAKYKNKTDKEKVFEIIGNLYNDCKSQQP